MPLSAGLWDELVPPEVWINVKSLGEPEHDFITVTVRVKEMNKRSCSAAVNVSRYAPTDSIILAVSKCFVAMAIAQCEVGQAMLKEQLESAVRSWVDPF
jgi:hypothetical protein